MKFAVGYQQPETGGSFPKIVADYRDHIDEVYFAWPETPSGRRALSPESQDVLEDDLREMRRLGVRLDLLFNASCYGNIANSGQLADNVVAIMRHLDSVCGIPEVVTTTSPAIAHVVKRNFPDTETRASVNMRIGTVQAMRYAAPLFDGFCVQRDVQRNIACLRGLKRWCSENGKRLSILANSGCLRFCPGQTFHDNAVAHNAKTGGRHGDLPQWNPHACWRLYADRANLAEFLKSTWIRPEDIALYSPFADVIKLATRQHSHPRMVIGAYTSGTFAGNLLNLTEPCLAEAFAPHYVENSAFPENWAAQTSQCDSQCHQCGFCDQTLKSVLKTFPPQ